MTDRRLGTRAWQRTRLVILARDSWTCHYCGARLFPGLRGDYAATVDHIVQRVDGGTDDPSNLVACCARCQNPARRPRFLSAGSAPDASRRRLPPLGMGPIQGDPGRPSSTAGSWAPIRARWTAKPDGS